MTCSDPAKTRSGRPGLLSACAVLLALAGGCAALPAAPAPGSPRAALLQAGALFGTAAQGEAGQEELPQEAGLQDYKRYAALNNPGLEAAFNRWRAAVERIPQVTALPDPRFTYRYYIDEVETRVGPQEQSFSVAQMFPWFGKLKLRGDVATEAAFAAQQRYEAAKLNLFYRIADAYYEYYYLARAIAVVERMRDLMERLEGVARSRYKVGAAGYPAIIRAQVEIGKLEDRLRTLTDLRGPIVARLNAALNRPMAAPLPWPQTVPQTQIAASDEEVLAWLAEASPELTALDHEVARQGYRMALAAKDYYPDVTLGLTYIDTGSALMPSTPDDSKDPLIAMVSVNVPLWRQKYRAAKREAAAKHRSALRIRGDRTNLLSAKAKMVLFKLRDAERKVDLFRDTLLPKARQSLNATETAFSAGKGTFLDLVDSERVLLEFALSHERALADRAQRLEELEMLVGRRMPVKAAPLAAEDNQEDGT